jgi:large subunit ribosomal protein L7A
MIAMLDQLRQAPVRTVGTKQTLRAVERGQARVVFVARDAEPHVVRQLVGLCRQRGLPVEEVESMEALGRCCGVEVGAASAAILGAPSPGTHTPRG